MELFHPLQITLACGCLTKLGGCNLTQARNALAGYSCFDPWNERTPGHRTLHPYEQRYALLFTADRGAPLPGSAPPGDSE